MSNIAEGFERGSEADFSRFLFIAKGSCGEIRSQLYVALDLELVDRRTFENLATQASRVSRMLHALNRAVIARSRTKKARRI